MTDFVVKDVGAAADGLRRDVASRHTLGVEDEQPPICPVCGVTMVPATLSAVAGHAADWVCVECEETGEPDAS